MQTQEITKQDQDRYDREMTEKALAGATIIRVMIVVQIAGLVFRFFTVDEWIAFRIIDTVIEVFFIIEFRRGAQWVRALLVASSVLNVARSVRMLILVLSAGISAGSTIVLIGLCLLDLAAAGGWIFFLIIDKRVDCYFRFMNSPRYHELIRKYESEESDKE